MSDLCTTCQHRLLQSGDLDAETAAHVAVCPTCQAIRESIRAIKEEKRLLDPAPDALLKNILQSLPTTPPPPIPADGSGAGSLVAPAKYVGIIGTLVVALLVGGSWVLRSPAPQVESPAITQPALPTETPGHESVPATKTIPLPLTRPMPTGSDSVSIIGPDVAPD